MKKCNGYAFLSGLAMAAAFVFFVIWSVVPIDGQTLPHLLAANWQWSFRFSAILVSLMTAVLGMCALLVFAVMAVRSDDGGERNSK